MPIANDCCVALPFDDRVWFVVHLLASHLLGRDNHENGA